MRSHQRARSKSLALKRRWLVEKKKVRPLRDVAEEDAGGAAGRDADPSDDDDDDDDDSEESDDAGESSATLTDAEEAQPSRWGRRCRVRPAQINRTRAPPVISRRRRRRCWCWC